MSDVYHSNSRPGRGAAPAPSRTLAGEFPVAPCEAVSSQYLQIPISPTVSAIVEQLHATGHRALVVGGAVRDALLGNEPKDVDIEVYGISYEALAKLLSQYGRADTVGRSFGVVKLSEPGGVTDFSIPRRDNKVGRTHTDFACSFDPTMTPQDAAARRDFTWNALAYDPLRNELHDYFGGQRDLELRIIRATSPAFSEDPLRVLRGMQFAARLNATVELETAALCQALVGEYQTLPQRTDRRGVDEARNQSHIALADLSVSSGNRLIQLYPQLKAIVGVQQDPQWHPEGTVDVHTGHVLDAAARIAQRDDLTGDDRAVLFFATLGHDFAKAQTTELPDKSGVVRVRAIGHEKMSGPLAREFLESLGIKAEIIQSVVPLVENHLAHLQFTDTEVHPRVAFRLARRIQPASIETLARVIEADHSGRPPLPAERPIGATRMLEMAQFHRVTEKPEPPLIQGRDLIARGMTPGKQIGVITRAALELQTDGHFLPPDHASMTPDQSREAARTNALVWLNEYLQREFPAG